MVSGCLRLSDILPHVCLNDTFKPLGESLSPEHGDFVAILSAAFLLGIHRQLAPQGDTQVPEIKKVKFFPRENEGTV